MKRAWSPPYRFMSAQEEPVQLNLVGIGFALPLALLLAVPASFGQTALPFDCPSFRGTLHDNVSNQEK